MKKQTPHKQIKALDAEIARLQNSLPKLELKEFETTCERINQLEIKRVQLLNPIENEQPLTWRQYGHSHICGKIRCSTRTQVMRENKPAKCSKAWL